MKRLLLTGATGYLGSSILKMITGRNYLVNCANRVSLPDTNGIKNFKIDGKRIYSTDTSGNRLYNKPSHSISNAGQIYETDSSGNRRYEGQNYRLDGNKILPTDSSGNRQYKTEIFFGLDIRSSTIKLIMLNR